MQRTGASRTFAWLAVLLCMFVCPILVSCNGHDRAPPGYIDACYGGEGDMGRNLSLSDNRISVAVQGKEKDWPLVAKIVREAGEKHGLKVFDGSRVNEHVHMLEISACDPSGIFMIVDKRVYQGTEYHHATLNYDGDRIETLLTTYKPEADWRPIAETLISMFKAQWPGEVQAVYLPIVPISERALPTWLRLELELEGKLKRQ